MLNYFLISLQIFGIYILADFFTGLFHWWEDTYGNPRWPILGKYIILPNLNHHLKPRAIVENTYWNRVKLSVLVAIILIAGLAFLKLLSWQICFFLFLASQGNEFHAITHRTERENGLFITMLQKMKILQSKKEHGLHHTKPYDKNFCVMTSFTNNILTKFKFWFHLEKFLSFCGIEPLRGSSERNFA